MTPACLSFFATVESAATLAPTSAYEPAGNLVSYELGCTACKLTSCFHLVLGADVAFDKDGKAMQRSAAVSEWFVMKVPNAVMLTLVRVHIFSPSQAAERCPMRRD
jgi:hypothetical protein